MGIGFNAERAEYLCAALAPARRTRIVDVGANPINDNPYSGLMGLGLCDVWGFEPQPLAFEKLQKSPRPNTHYLPYAVGADAEAELKICQSSGFTSLLEPNVAAFDALGRFHRAASVVDRQVIRTRTLDSMEDVPEFDLLKIDIQGGEVDVFEGGKAKLESAIAIITEVAGTPIYENQPLLDTQMATLRAQGFDFHKLMTTSSFSFLGRNTSRMHRRKFRSQFVDGDAVFIRSVLALSALDTERLKHLAILADAVFDSQDVAVAAMTVLEDRDAFTGEAIDLYLDRLPFTEPRGEGAAAE